MAADAYLKSAASHLMQAATQLRSEVRHLEGEHKRSRHDRETLINKNSLEIKARQAEVDLANDDSQRTHAINEIQKMEQEIEQAKRELQEIEATLQNTMRAKSSMSDNLERQARQLESQSSAPELQ